ncbi:MAG: 16S rRNA (guanine(527)-N(7))-methyltransferase RsmG [Caulobacteraceae bacterium]|nr:16S rRNA (guanine(527)-N(7))-methyltransferase RsmG [Caulobacteraceae bacterium]
MSAAAPHDALSAPEGFLEAVGATPERLAAVEAFRLMLEAANARSNLVGRSTLPGFWRRHFLDSAQLAWLAPSARIWADLGSGAGLPGLVLAILMKGRAGAHVHLVESVAKRCAFLTRVATALDLPVTIHHARAEALALEVDTVTARACAPLTRLLEFAAPTMRPGAAGLFLKGQGVDIEITEARRSWRFDAFCHESLSDPRGRVVSVTGLARVG